MLIFRIFLTCFCRRPEIISRKIKEVSTLHISYSILSLSDDVPIMTLELNEN